jgi:hypothetical protein
MQSVDMMCENMPPTIREVRTNPESGIRFDPFDSIQKLENVTIVVAKMG